MIARFMTLILLLLSAATAHGQQSSLPLIQISTDDSLTAQSKNVRGKMTVSYMDDRILNSKDSTSLYSGWISISTRGKSSRSFPKLSFSIETQKKDSSNKNVTLLGMPKENDWVLYAPYSDKTLMRNHLVYGLSEEMGHYAPRCRFVEVYINKDYRGVYVLMEKVKEDPNRVDTDRPSSDDSKDAFLLEMTFKEHVPKNAKVLRGAVSGNYYVIKYPRGRWLTEWRIADLQSYLDEFEQNLYKICEAGPCYYTPIYDKVNMSSLIDFYLINEAFRNPDGFRASTYLSKSTDDTLFFGPVWDFNLAMGNYQYSPHINTTGMCLPECEIAWPFVRDPEFRKALAERWAELRESLLSDQEIKNRIAKTSDLLNDAQQRNFKRWPIQGKHVWPNPPDRIKDSYEEEVSQMESWIIDRFNYLDTAFLNLENYRCSFVPRMKNDIAKFGCESMEDYYSALKVTDADYYFFDKEQLNRLGQQYMRLEEYECGIRALELNCKEYPSVYSYMSLGKAYESIEQYEKAVEVYTILLQLNPDNSEAKDRIIELKK